MQSNNCNCNDKSLHTVQAFDRQVSPSATALVARADGGHWRFLINSDKLIKITIQQDSTLNQLKPKIVYVHPNSGQEIQGRGSVILQCENLDTTTATVFTANLKYLDRLEPVEYGDVVNSSALSAWVTLGSNSGYPQAYTNYVRIYASEQIRIRQIDTATGNTILQLGVQPTDEVVLRDLQTQVPAYWEVRQSVSNAIPCLIQAIWFRN